MNEWGHVCDRSNDATSMSCLRPPPSGRFATPTHISIDRDGTVHAIAFEQMDRETTIAYAEMVLDEPSTLEADALVPGDEP